MSSNPVARPAPVGMYSRADERRKNPRFDMRFAVFLRVPGDPWTVSETTEVSATGASFVTDRPFLLNIPVEYVLTLPPELTKAQRVIRVRFYGSVLRCERIANGNGTFAVAVRNTTYRYLSSDEAAVFEDLEQKQELSDRSGQSPERRTGT